MAGQQPNQSDNSMGMLWIMIAIVVFGAIIWFFYSEYIISIYLHIKLVEIYIISLFTDALEPAQQYISTVAPQNYQSNAVFDITESVGAYIKYPLAIILAILAVMLFNTNTKSRFKTIFSMNTLLGQERQNWPCSGVVSKLDLVNEHIEKGKWAISATPLQFAEKYKMLKIEKVKVQRGPREYDDIKATVIRSAANKVFTKQLGRTWKGPDKLPVHRKALFAAFAAKACGNDKGARALLNRISNSAVSGKPSFQGTNELLNKHINDKLIKRAMPRHGYELTMMATMLELARLDGVIPCSEFLWLKPLDRSLWYTLNSVGRQTCVSEAAGIFAHWLAEKSVGKRLQLPMVQEATMALEEAILSVKYTEKD